MFVITTNIDGTDVPVYGPAGWGTVAQAYFNLIGNLNPPPRPYTHNGYTLVDAIHEVTDAYQNHGDGSIINGEWVIPAQDLPLADAKAIAKSTLASNRYEIETGGILIPGIGEIATDRETRATLLGARVLAKENSAYTVKWKTPGGFVTLDASMIIAVADAVREHVQACFDHEMAISAQIDAATSVDELRGVDLNRALPA